MTSTITTRWALPLLCLMAMASRTVAAPPEDAKPDEPAPQQAAVAPVSWISNLGEANRRALSDRKPLVILVGAKWCAPCRKMAMEMHLPAVETELARWTPVYLDLEAQATEAAELGAVAVPAFRIHSPGGQQVARHDGYLAPEDFVNWLKENYEAATAAADESLLSTGQPDAAAVVRLIAQFRQRNPALREAAVRRLTPYPQVARPLVIKAFLEGSLTTRLAALDVLEQWKAPLADLDPWRPETFTPDRVAQLEKWSSPEHAGELAPAAELSPEQLADARRQIDRMLATDEATADAIRQRLAGLGSALLPEVYSRLKDVASDEERRRLLILRHRLTASDSLVLRWPGGIERLADTDVRLRRQAADELAKQAGADEQALLLELFADTDPLVREIGLRGLQNIGGKEANAALVKLLSDPEPNVRAAVLKQLQESPAPTMTPAVVKYLSTEKDPDLIVHGIRFLRTAQTKESMRCLISLLRHESWQVRAEAAVGIGKQNDEGHQFVSLSHSSPASSNGEPDEATKLKVEGYMALLDLLDDGDGFVVAKAVEGLANADLAAAVEPLAKAAETHPDLATNILTTLAKSGQMRDKAIPHLRRFCKHDQARIRAAAVAALTSAASGDAEQEVLAALADAEGEVRIAAAQSLFSFLNQSRRDKKSQLENPQNASSPPIFHSTTTTSSPGIVQTVVSKVLSVFGATTPPPPAETDVPAESLPVPTGPAPAVPPDAVPIVVDNTPIAVPEPAEAATPDASKPDEPNPDDSLADQTADPSTNPETSASQLDTWIEECCAGRYRPSWTSNAVPLLEKMLLSEAPKERLAAAIALLPLGKADEAMPVLLETVRATPEVQGRAVESLPWLPLDRRIAVFRELRSMAASPQDRERLVDELTEEIDPRLADLMWELLADPDVSDNEASSLHRALTQVYFGAKWYSPSEVSPSDRRDLAKAAKPRTTEGSSAQRRVALVLLISAAPDEAAEIAAQLADDQQLDESFRTDAFQALLVAQTPADAKKTSLAAVKGTDAARKKLGIKYIVHGPYALHMFSSGIYLNGMMNVTISNSSGSGMPIIPQPPAGVTTDDVQPLLTDSDREIAACAGYLLTLLGNPDAIEPLLQYWRQNQNSDEWRKLVYRAIAVTDAPKHIPLLREIYSKLDDYEVSEFYWTIRIMSGPEILQFRKQIRSEKADKLR